MSNLAEEQIEGAEGDVEEQPVDNINDRVIPINCNADATNRFYGNKGALQCLSEEGDVAILELQYLKCEYSAYFFSIKMKIYFTS